MDYTVSYDSTTLRLLDAAAQAYGTNLAVGAVPGTSLVIDSITGGTVTLSFNRTISQGKLWSGVITILKFEVLSSGETTVSVE